MPKKRITRKVDSRIISIRNRLNCHKQSTGKARTSYCHLKVQLPPSLTHGFAILSRFSLSHLQHFHQIVLIWIIVFFHVTAAIRIQREPKGDAASQQVLPSTLPLHGCMKFNILPGKKLHLSAHNKYCLKQVIHQFTSHTI